MSLWYYNTSYTDKTKFPFQLFNVLKYLHLFSILPKFLAKKCLEPSMEHWICCFIQIWNCSNYENSWSYNEYFCPIKWTKTFLRVDTEYCSVAQKWYFDIILWLFLLDLIIFIFLSYSRYFLFHLDISWEIMGNIFTQMYYISILLISGNLNIELQLLKNCADGIFSQLCTALCLKLYLKI